MTSPNNQRLYVVKIAAATNGGKAHDEFNYTFRF